MGGRNMKYIGGNTKRYKILVGGLEAKGLLRID
jgi:hypothetical protein